MSDSESGSSSDRESSNQVNVIEKGEDVSIRKELSAEAIIPTETSLINTSTGNTGQLPSILATKLNTQLGRIIILEDIDNLDFENWKIFTVEDIASYFAQLDEVHNAFIKNHAYFEKVWPIECLPHDYFTNHIHVKEARLYRQACSLLRKTQKKLSTQSQPNVTMSNKQSDKYEPTDCTTTMLTLNLLMFDGTYESWPAFKELFFNLVVNNQSFPDDEKFTYLMKCLPDQVAKLISNLPAAGSSLKSALILLAIHYENNRLLIQSLLDKFFGISSEMHRSSTDMKKILVDFTECDNILEHLKIEQGMWDVIKVYRITKLMDNVTRKKWEASLGATHEYPRYAQLKLFLTNQVHALETIESANTHSDSKNTDTTINPKVESSNESLDIVELRDLCFKCSSRSKVDSRYIFNKCKNCDAKHKSDWKVLLVPLENICTSCSTNH